MEQVLNKNELDTKSLKIIGTVTFAFCLLVSFSFALNFYVNLATNIFEIVMMVVAALVQDGVKAFAIIKYNFFKDYGFKREARGFLAVYLFALFASLVSGIGSGLHVSYIKNSENARVSYSVDQSILEKSIILDKDRLIDKQNTLSAKNSALLLIETDTTEDEAKKRANARTKATLDKEILTLKKEIDTLKETIKKNEIEVLAFDKREAEENRDKKPTMFNIISETFGWNLNIVTSVAFALLVGMIELGLNVTAVHPKLTTKGEDKKIGRPVGSKNRPKKAPSLVEEVSHDRVLDIEVEPEPAPVEAPEIQIEIEPEPEPDRIEIPITPKEPSLGNISTSLFPRFNKRRVANEAE